MRSAAQRINDRNNGVTHRRLLGGKVVMRHIPAKPHARVPIQRKERAIFFVYEPKLLKIIRDLM